MTIKLFIHDIALDQLSGTAVGTAVCAGGRQGILDIVEAAVGGFDFPANGQGFVPLPEGAKALVLTGSIRRPADCPEAALKVRMHRGEPMIVGRGSWFVSQGADLRPTFVAAIVYTMAAFDADPETTAGEVAEATMERATHVLITIIGSQAPAPPVSSHRFVRNLGGGNAKARQRASHWDFPNPPEGGAAHALLNELEGEAAAIVAYEREWLTLG